MSKRKSAEDAEEKNLVAVVRRARLSLDIRSELDGRGGIRYYFNHPTLKNRKGTRAKKMHNPSLDVVKQWATDILEDLSKDQKTLTRSEFVELLGCRQRLERAEAELHDTGLSLEMFLGQLLPALRRLPPEILPATVIDRGLAHFIPKNPMTLNQVFQELFPTLETNVLSEHAKSICRHCRPLLTRKGENWVHKVGAAELEAVMTEIDRGEFVSAEKKEKLMARRLSELADPSRKPECQSIYDERSREHVYDAWRRLYRRALARGAWPTEEPLPTEVMERPDGGPGDGPVIPVKDWKKLLPLLDLVERRLVVLLIADMRPAEIDRSKTSAIVLCTDGLPQGINIPPSEHAKESEGRWQDFCPTVAVLLESCMPTGEDLLPERASRIMARIYEKAEANGIKLTKNCIRRAHDSYWYGLKGGTQQLNVHRSHSRAMTEGVYRRKKSVQDSAEFFRTLTVDIPDHRRKWVLDWVDGEVRGMRGGEILAPAPAPSPQGDSSTAAQTKPTAGPSEPASSPQETSIGIPLVASPPAEISDGTTNDPQLVQAERGRAGINGHAPESVTGLPESALLPPTAPPPAVGGSKDGQMPISEPPRRPDGRVAWKHLPWEIQIDLFSKYTPNEIAKAWSLKRGAVYQQIRKARAAVARGTAAVDTANNTSDAGCVVTPGPDLCLAKRAESCGDNPGNPKQAEPKQGGLDKSDNLSKPATGSPECADSRPAPPVGGVSLPASSIQQTIPEPPHRTDGKVDWKQLSQEFLINLFSTHTPVEVAQAWAITRPAVYQQIRKLKAAAAHRGSRESAIGQATVSRLSPILPNVGRARITWPSSKADFLQALWDFPATHIAKRLECSQAMVLTKAEQWNLPRPGPGYFQRKNKQIPVEMSQEAKERLAELRSAEAAAAKRTMEESPVPPPVNGDGRLVPPVAVQSGDKGKVIAPTTAVESEEVPEPGFPTTGPGTSGPFEAQRDFVFFRPMPKHTFSHTSSNAASHPDADSKPQTNINNAKHEKSKC